MKLLRRAPYNREVVFFDRLRVPYAPAYGWRSRGRDVLAAAAGRTPSQGRGWPSGDDVDPDYCESCGGPCRDESDWVDDDEQPDADEQAGVLSGDAVDAPAVLEGDAAVGSSCCASEIYWCPRVGRMECPTHGGFDTCCDHPERHTPLLGFEPQAFALLKWWRENCQEVHHGSGVEAGVADRVHGLDDGAGVALASPAAEVGE